ncbi:MAG TPA: hypothetical protein VMZ04_05190, partial [Anaerolineae bacterium]|nr:hypothetical protein [Anaerolineae bacterium]
PGNVNLTFVYSEMDESSLIYEKIWYYDNCTTYKFTTFKTYVEWWFTPGVRYFIFQNIDTGKLYSVCVNYTDIDIPENPYEERHHQLIENYTLILNNYNLTNSTLANITLHFNELNNTYILIMHQLNMTKRDYLNASKDLTNMTIEFNDLEDEYDNRTALWHSALNSSISYETSYDDEVFDYNQLEKDHNNLSGAMPWYIIIAVIGTFLFTYIYIRRKTIFEESSETTDEITTSYGKIHSAIDKHILSRFKKEPKKDEGGIEEVTEWKEAPKEEFTPDEKQKIQKSINDAKEGKITPLKVEKPEKITTPDDILTIMHEKIDANTRATNIKIDTNAKEFNTKIENLFEGIDEKIKQIAKARA